MRVILPSLNYAALRVDPFYSLWDRKPQLPCNAKVPESPDCFTKNDEKKNLLVADCATSTRKSEFLVEMPNTQTQDKEEETDGFLAFFATKMDKRQQERSQETETRPQTNQAVQTDH